jgi:hypothetical protein
VAAQVIRRIPVDHARRHSAGKRGEGVPCVPIYEAKEVAAATRIQRVPGGTSGYRNSELRSRFAKKMTDVVKLC